MSQRKDLSPPLDTLPDDDARRPARGMVIGVLLSLLLWGMFVLGVYALVWLR